MANKAAVDTTTGLIQSVITPSSSKMMPDGMMIGGLMIKDLPKSANPRSAKSNLHWSFTSDSWGTHAPKKIESDSWDNTNKKWNNNIQEYAKDRYDKLKTDLYRFIVKTCDFPEWKQANTADTYAELSIKKLTTSVTPEEQATIDNIVAIRAWKNSLLAERDRVKAKIYSQSTNTTNQIDTIVKSFVYASFPN